MANILGVGEAKRRFSELMSRVAYRQERFIIERQEPPRDGRYIDQDGRECRVLIPSRYDATKDRDEMRKVKRQLNALAAKKRKRARKHLAREARPAVPVPAPA